jgi:hypothetical protein
VIVQTNTGALAETDDKILEGTVPRGKQYRHAAHGKQESRYRYDVCGDARKSIGH